MYVRDLISDNPRPINNIKNYGAVRHGEDESVARFCRIVFAGCASSRFHRPHPLEDPTQHEAASEFGLGLSPLAQRVIQSLRWVVGEIDIASSYPQNDLLSERQENEAYVLADSEQQYAVYFPKGGEVVLHLNKTNNKWEVVWLNVITGDKIETVAEAGNKTLLLRTPEIGHWVAVIKP